MMTGWVVLIYIKHDLYVLRLLSKLGSTLHETFRELWTSARG